MSAIEHQLDIIKKVAEAKETELDERYYKKHIRMFEDTVSFLKYEKVLLYGGQAIHDLMPPKYKIYPKYKLPDIDIFALDGQKLAGKVKVFLEKKGYNYVYVTEALKEGTLKLFAEGIQILDITGIPKSVYTRLAKHSVVPNRGIRVVNPLFLRLSMHMILSQSVDAFRWEKTYKRLVNFYKVFPPRPCRKVPPAPTKVPSDMLDKIYDIFEDTDYIVFGHREIPRGAPAAAAPKLTVLVEGANLHNFAQDVVDLLNDPAVSVGDTFTKDKLLPAHVYIMYKKEPLIIIFDAETCMTYNKVRKLNIASIHTILRLFLGIMLSADTLPFKKYADIIECYANSISGNKNDDNQFVTQCYGHMEGVVTLRLNRIDRNKK